MAATLIFYSYLSYLQFKSTISALCSLFFYLAFEMELLLHVTMCNLIRPNSTNLVPLAYIWLWMYMIWIDSLFFIFWWCWRRRIVKGWKLTRQDHTELWGYVCLSIQLGDVFAVSWVLSYVDVQKKPDIISVQVFLWRLSRTSIVRVVTQQDWRGCVRMILSVTEEARTFILNLWSCLVFWGVTCIVHDEHKLVESA